MGRRFFAGLRIVPLVLAVACAAPAGAPTDDTPGDTDTVSVDGRGGHGGGWGWGWGWGGWGWGDCGWGWWGHDHHHDCDQKFADVTLSGSHGQVLQTSDTSWTFTKTGVNDRLAHVITWTLTASQISTTGADLVFDGDITAKNIGKGSATIGNIVVNLQTRVSGKWVTQSSDVADATNGDNATVAHTAANAATGGQSTFVENAQSGSLSFMDRHTNTVFSLVPEVVVAPHGSEKLLFSATFHDLALALPAGTPVRAQVILTFGNHAAGDANVTDEDVDINGNGTIDPDEHTVRSVSASLERAVPSLSQGNSTIALADALADITTQGTVSFSNATFNLGATTGTVSVKYDGGAAGGSITNCASADASGVTDIIGGNPVVIVNPVHLQACNTQAVGPDTCTPGTAGCGWKDGQLQTYAQTDWSQDPAASTLLDDNFDTLYPLTGLIIGGSKTITFTNSEAIEAYVPVGGAPGPLDASLANPTSTASGVFGGDVTALALDVDFSDAHLLPDSAGVSFGDLSLCGTAVPDNTSVRQLLATANTALGGGNVGISYADLDATVASTSAAFTGGTPTSFAQAHLVNGTCP